MNRFVRNIRKGLRRALNVKTVTLDGIVVSTERSAISKLIREGLFKGTYEEPERILIRDGLEAGDRVLEIGGGIGFVSLLCAKICGAENVLTYEANPAMAAIIERNYALNGLRPNLRPKAISVTGGDVTIYITDNIVSSSLHERSEGKRQTVPADGLDDVIAEWKPTAIVMDVEGAEISILGGSKLEGVKKLIVELHPQIVGEPAIITLKKHLQEREFAETRAVHKSCLFARDAGRH